MANDADRWLGNGMLRGVVIGAMVLIGMTAGPGCGHSRTKPMVLDLPDSLVGLGLDVSNFNGSITVRADGADAGEVLVVADRFASGGVTRDEADDVIEEIRVDASVEGDGPLGVLRVSTSTLSDCWTCHGVDLTIIMPRCDGLTVRNSGGHVSVTDAGGTVDIQNERGSIEFRTSRRMTESVTLVTTDGEVYYQVPPESTGVFDMVTLDGRTTLKDRAGAITDTYTAGGMLRFTLNEGGNPVVMRSSRGNVRAWIMEEPLSLVRTFKRDKGSIRDQLYLQGTRRHTRGLPTDTPREGTRHAGDLIYSDLPR